VSSESRNNNVLIDFFEPFPRNGVSKSANVPGLILTLWGGGPFLSSTPYLFSRLKKTQSKFLERIEFEYRLTWQQPNQRNSPGGQAQIRSLPLGLTGFPNSEQTLFPSDFILDGGSKLLHSKASGEVFRSTRDLIS